LVFCHKVSIWVLIFTLIMLATESTHVIHLVTRFTEEIFSFLIALVFLTDAIKKIFNASFFFSNFCIMRCLNILNKINFLKLKFQQYFAQNPIYNSAKYCSLKYPNLTLLFNTDDLFSYYSNLTTDEYANYTLATTTTTTTTPYMIAIQNDYCGKNNTSSDYKYTVPEPNIALISMILLIGTCFLALGLKELRNSKFLPGFVS
jgi:hypothetical protein